MAAVVGVPDPARTQRVKAFVVLTDPTEAADALAAAIRDHVRARLAAHAYPRDIAFVDALPQTATGKIRRAELRQRG